MRGNKRGKSKQIYGWNHGVEKEEDDGIKRGKGTGPWGKASENGIKGSLEEGKMGISV